MTTARINLYSVHPYCASTRDQYYVRSAGDAVPVRDDNLSAVRESLIKKNDGYGLQGLQEIPPRKVWGRM